MADIVDGALLRSRSDRLDGRGGWFASARSEVRADRSSHFPRLVMAALTTRSTIGPSIIGNDSPIADIRCIRSPMSWDAKDVALLKELWAAGHSAGQIATRLGYSRNAVSAKLKRLGHKRGPKPPTSNTGIGAVPTGKQTPSAASAPPRGWEMAPRK